MGDQTMRREKKKSSVFVPFFLFLSIGFQVMAASPSWLQVSQAISSLHCPWFCFDFSIYLVSGNYWHHLLTLSSRPKDDSYFLLLAITGLLTSLLAFSVLPSSIWPIPSIKVLSVWKLTVVSYSWMDLDTQDKEGLCSRKRIACTKS